jgi:hypothetical protein
MDSNDSGLKLVNTDIIALISTVIDDSKLHIQQPSIKKQALHIIHTASCTQSEPRRVKKMMKWW